MEKLKDRLKQARLDAGLTQAELARKAGLSNQSIVASLETGYRKASRYIPALAKVLGVESLWLSDGLGQRSSRNQLPNMSELEDAVINYKLKGSDYFEIKQYEAKSSIMGSLLMPDRPGEIKSFIVNKEWLLKNLKGYKTTNNLCVVTAFGDSMKPLFNPGDPILVDLSVTTVETDSIYFFRVDNEGFIKRLQRIPGVGIKVLSANRDIYESWTIRSHMDFQIIGRVVKIWKSENF